MSDPCTHIDPYEPGATTAGGAELPQRICTVLDDAHHTLAADELAQLLLSVGELARPLAEGRPPNGRLDGGAQRPPAAVGAFLDPTHDMIHAWAGEPTGRDPAGRRDLGRWLATYLDEVASRPRGAAVPTG